MPRAVRRRLLFGGETFIADNIMLSGEISWMLRALIVGGLLLSSDVSVCADDAVKTDPDKYKVVLENERVRVLEYRDKPGQKTKMHTHPDFVCRLSRRSSDS